MRNGAYGEIEIRLYVRETKMCSTLLTEYLYRKSFTGYSDKRPEYLRPIIESVVISVNDR